MTFYAKEGEIIKANFSNNGIMLDRTKSVTNNQNQVVSDFENGASYPVTKKEDGEIIANINYFFRSWIDGNYFGIISRLSVSVPPDVSVRNVFALRKLDGPGPEFYAPGMRFTFLDEYFHPLPGVFIDKPDYHFGMLMEFKKVRRGVSNSVSEWRDRSRGSTNFAWEDVRHLQLNFENFANIGVNAPDTI